MQLFCFTIAGGTAAFFDKLEDCCKGRIDFVKLEYPGHGRRRKEPLCSSFQQIAADLYLKIKEDLDGSGYALLGYSMGSIAATEVLRTILVKEEIPLPKMVFLSAHAPKAVVDVGRLTEDDLDEYVKQRTVRFGGVPEGLIENRSFWRVYLPLYKADYQMIGRYDFRSLRFSTDVPAVVFYSQEDTPRADMDAWTEYFHTSCEFVEYSGSHFFINEHCEQMGDLIMKKLGVTA